MNKLKFTIMISIMFLVGFFGTAIVDIALGVQPTLNKGPEMIPGIISYGLVPDKIEIWRVTKSKKDKEIKLAEFYPPWEKDKATYSEYTDRNVNKKLKIKKLEFGIENANDNIDCFTLSENGILLYWTDKKFMTADDGTHVYEFRFYNEGNLKVISAGILEISDSTGKVCFTRDDVKRCI
jgi:hypothetical protein